MSDFKINGLNEMEQDLLRIAMQMPKEEERILKTLAYRFERKVKLRTPLDTGNLRGKWKVGSIKRTINGTSITVDNNTEYALMVEEGHRTQNGGFVPGQHFTKISLEQNKKELPTFLKTELRRIFR